MKTGKRIKPKKAVIKSGKVLNAFESRDQENDWTIPGQAFSEYQIPGKLDLRRKVSSRWSRPFDQGQTGSCVGQAVAKALWWHLLSKRKVPSARQRYVPSVRYLWMAPKEFDVWEAYPSTMLQQSGTYIKSSLDILRKHGCPPDKILPFDSPGSMLSDSEFNKTADRYKIKAYRATSPYGEGFGYEGFKWWLSNRGPIVARLNVDHQFMTARRNSPILETYKKAHPYGGHAVLIVGYDKNDNFLVMNSWGYQWGNDKGCQWVSRDYARAAFTESYGIEV